MTKVDYAASGSVPGELEHPAVANLRAHQTQLDADGIMVGVSRQALEELLALYDGMLSAPIYADEVRPSGRSQQKPNGISS